jgi:hypothetical protein
MGRSLGKMERHPRHAAIATDKVTIVYANDGLNRTIDCADDQMIFDAPV